MIKLVMIIIVILIRIVINKLIKIRNIITMESYLKHVS